jgi:hypothetical protein
MRMKSCASPLYLPINGFNKYYPKNDRLSASDLQGRKKDTSFQDAKTTATGVDWEL